jgi:hypothetical protein
VRHQGCEVPSQKHGRGNLALGDRVGLGEDDKIEGYMAYTFPQPIFPCPNTKQYGFPGRRRYNPLGLPKQKVKYESEVFVNITNRADILEKSFADRLVDRSREYTARIDGWVLEFWNKDQFDERAAKLELIHPEGYIDMRTIRGVEYEKLVSKNLSGVAASFPWEVTLNTKEGLFRYNVHDEWDAFRWQGVIKMAMVDNFTVQQEKKAIAKDMVSTKSGVIEQSRDGPQGSRTHMERSAVDSLMHYTLNPARERQLRTLWKTLVRSTVKGEPLDQTVFAAMYELYDFDGDQNLDPDEIEIMLKELYTVRFDELHRALDQQEKICFSPDKLVLNAAAAEKEWRSTVGNIGNKLKEQYAYLLQRHGFESRAAALRLALDSSHDGTVGLTEFVRGAPSILLPKQELQMEGQFYLNCAHAIETIKKQSEDLERLVYDDDSEDSDDGGCIQQ